MHEVLVNRLGGLSLTRKSVVRLTDRPDMTLDVYRGRKTTAQRQQQQALENHKNATDIRVYFAFKTRIGFHKKLSVINLLVSRSRKKSQLY